MSDVDLEKQILSEKYNKYATRKSLANESLNLAMLIMYINVIYKTIVEAQELGFLAPTAIFKLVIVIIGIGIQVLNMILGCILIRRTKDEPGRRCRLKSTLLNDSITILSFMTAVLNALLERF